MYKIAAIIGGVLLMAGVALAGTVSSLGSPTSPTISTCQQRCQTAGSDGAQGRKTAAAKREARGRANEAGEDLRGPCDEAEHANDPRCTGAAPPRPPQTTMTTIAAHHNSGPGSSNSGHGGELRPGRRWRVRPRRPRRRRLISPRRTRRPRPLSGAVSPSSQSPT